MSQDLKVSHFLAHQRRHRNKRPFVCADCNKRFFQTSDLHVHQMTHKKEKPFTCSKYRKSFTYKTNLQAHERIHTGEKPYKCPLCHRSFCQSSTYNRHRGFMRNLDPEMFPLHQMLPLWPLGLCNGYECKFRSLFVYAYQLTVYHVISWLYFLFTFSLY